MHCKIYAAVKVNQEGWEMGSGQDQELPVPKCNSTSVLEFVIKPVRRDNGVVEGGGHARWV